MPTKPGIYLRGGDKESFKIPGKEIGDREIVIATDTGEIGTTNGWFNPFAPSPGSVGKIDYQYNSEVKTFGTTWTLGYEWKPVEFSGGSRIKVDWRVPMRNDTGGWGGGYISIDYSFDGGQTWRIASGSGYDGPMASGGDIITSMSGSFILTDCPYNDFTLQLRFYFRSYDSTLNVNGLRDIYIGDNGFFYTNVTMTEFTKNPSALPVIFPLSGDVLGDSSTIAYYPLDGDVENRIIDDYHGQWYGTENYTQSGVHGHAAVFNQASAVTFDFGRKLSAPISFTGWFKASGIDAGTSADVFGVYVPGGVQDSEFDVRLVTENQGESFYVVVTTAGNTYQTPPINRLTERNIFFYVSIDFNMLTFSLYAETGERLAIRTITLPGVSALAYNKIAIGASKKTDDDMFIDFFRGNIDNFRIHERPLEPGEVYAICNEGQML